MATSSVSKPEKSQYHHFIPRFILRNYSYPAELPTDLLTNKHRKKQGNKKSNRKNGQPQTEAMLHGINMSRDEVELTETPVAKTFGITDMYRDLNASTRQHKVEQQLSILESQAGQIISTVRKDFEAGKEDAWLTRTQRDTLRKFLFIMKYRGPLFHKRYFHEKAEDYNADDTEQMLKYMKEKGFTRPIDVWFDNISVILEMKMDFEMAWMDKLRKRIYPHDAEWCINNMQSFYMSLVTPVEKEDEFILTQNAYSIFEGASSYKVNPITGLSENTAYTEFHIFAPVSPKLFIVLRTFLLPVLGEDSPELSWTREILLQAATAPHVDPEQAGSYLRDLPITKPLNSYSNIVNGKLVVINKGPTGMSDKFGFRFFPISDVYVQRINKIMLDESYQIDLIVFSSHAATIKTLVKYLVDRDTKPHEANRLRAVMKLGQAVNLLRETFPAHERQDLPQVGLTELGFPEDKLYSLFQKQKRAQGIYLQLCGKPLDVKDFDQARGLLFMRIKMEKPLRSHSPTEREEARQKFAKDIVFTDSLPLQVIWIYVKRIRFMKHGGTMVNPSNVLEDNVLPEKYLYGAEDVIAASKDSFRKGAIRRLMFHASGNESLISKPQWGLVRELTLDDGGIRRLNEEKQLVLGDQGSICDCGIPALEDLAKLVRSKVTQMKPYEAHPSVFDSIFTTEEKIEMAAREVLHNTLKMAAADGQPNPVENEELRRVLFEVIYPGFGGRQIGRTGNSR